MRRELPNRRRPLYVARVVETTLGLACHQLERACQPKPIVPTKTENAKLP